MAKILTIFVKINNSSNVIRNQPNFIKTLKIPSLKSEEFLNIIANTKPEKRISNINIINNYTSEEIPPIVKIKKSKPKILQTSNISKATHPINPNPKNHSPINPRQNTQSKQNNHFILNKYKKPERNFDKSLYLDHQERKLSNKVCIKTDRNNNYSTNCDNTTNRIQNITLNVEKSRDLSEIIFNNGSLRTKQLIQRELKGFSIISPRKLLSNPYIEKKMNMLIKSIWKKK